MQRSKSKNQTNRNCLTMARKAEPGISYFPMNTDMPGNNKIKLIISEFQAKAWAVLVPLFCKIYREKGYYIDWEDEDMRLLFAQDECKCDLSFVNEVVARCIKRGVFDTAVFTAFGVLTSDRIQENYLEAKKRQKSVDLIDEFLLIEESVYKLFDNVNIIELNVDTITKKVNTSTQSKGKRKVKQKLEGEGDGAGALAYIQDDRDRFKAFQEWITRKAPTVAKMKEPFTIDEYLKLKENFTQAQVQNLLIRMHNWVPLLKKNKSAFYTLTNWSENSFNKTETQPNGPTGDNINDKLKAAGAPEKY